MVQGFSSYIKTIAVFLIFSSFIQLIMPNSDFKKYMDIVLGLIMIILLMKPLNNLLISQEKSIPELLNEKESIISKEILSNEIKYYEDAQNEIIIDNYKKQLGSEISLMIQQRFNIKVKQVIVEVVSDTSDSNFGAITCVSITLDTFNKDIDENNNIKKAIQDFYNISDENIYIE